MTREQTSLHITTERITAQEALRSAFKEKIGTEKSLFLFEFCAAAQVTLSVAAHVGEKAKVAVSHAMAGVYSSGIEGVQDSIRGQILNIAMDGIGKTNEVISAWTDKLHDAGASSADVESLSQDDQMYAFINQHLDLSGEIAQIQGL